MTHDDDDDKIRERILREGQAMTVYIRLQQHGPQTVGSVISAGLVDNADDAIAAMYWFAVLVLSWGT